MSLPGRTVRSVWYLGLLGAFSCAVFPEEATLPDRPVGSAGAANGAGKNSGGTSVLPSGGSSASTAGTATLLGGAPHRGGAPVAQGGAPNGDAGAPIGPGGAGGAVGMPGCTEPQERVVLVGADTWIEADKPSNGHGNDQVLSVVGGGQERRALLEVTLPAVPAGTVLLEATLTLHLQANADVGLAERRLQVRLLSQAVTEARTNWTNWGNGSSRKWLLPGGDFGSVIDSARISAGTAEGSLAFNVTATVQAAWSAAEVALPFIVMENGAPPPAPAELAFTSSEGDASLVPTLLLQYCEP